MLVGARRDDGTVMITRRARHDRLSAFLTDRDDVGLSALLHAGRPGNVGVGGGSTVLDIDGVPVFAKRVPLTDRELGRPQSTANLFGLPAFCQYGIVGPGFNAWRELAANTIVTEGVLAGETESFPLLHHWRVLPGRSPIAAELADIDAVVAALAGHPAVRVRLEELAAASHSLVLFTEYIPHALPDWLRVDPAVKAESVERQFAHIVEFLRDRELLHFDGHFGNLRSDGERIYLTDFGLATSPRFDLSDDERDFVGRSLDHDADYAAMRLVNWLVTDVCGVPVPATGGPVAGNEYVRQWAAGHVRDDVPPAVAAILTRHAPAGARMNGFYWRLFDGELTTPYPAG
jgi:hypothetical protein